MVVTVGDNKRHPLGASEERREEGHGDERMDGQRKDQNRCSKDGKDKALVMSDRIAEALDGF